MCDVDVSRCPCCGGLRDDEDDFDEQTYLDNRDRKRSYSAILRAMRIEQQNVLKRHSENEPVVVSAKVVIAWIDSQLGLGGS